MSWLQKLLPPKIQRATGPRKQVPEGLWTKCPACSAVLYSTDLEKNQNVCPKCGDHQRIGARARLDALLFGEAQGRIILSVAAVNAGKVLAQAKILGVAAAAIGTVGGGTLQIKTPGATLSCELAELHDLWWNSIARAMG